MPPAARLLGLAVGGRQAGQAATCSECRNWLSPRRHCMPSGSLRSTSGVRAVTKTDTAWGPPMTSPHQPVLLTGCSGWSTNRTGPRRVLRAECR